MTSPPSEVPPPERYLVLDTTSTSTPSAFRLVSVKGITVESAITGTPFLWAISAIAFRLATSS